MSETHLTLIAHLMRRAGFGSTREELEACTSKDYQALVEDLLHPERFPDIEEFEGDILGRYHYGRGLGIEESLNTWNGRWVYRMVNSRRPLEEKMPLFWHHVFATGYFKSEHAPTMLRQIATFRRNGLSDLRTILTDLSKDPAMIFWLDNCENRKGEPNENYGRELLELFSMGVGNYTEQDIKMAARAFTGWTFTQPLPLYPHGDHPSVFVYRPDDHDDSVKTFLGETGRFNGEDIIDIIVRQPATARFISRHLYNFFVADEPQVPSWNETPPQDPEAIEALVDAYFESGADIRQILRVLFNSDFFKEAQFKKVKSPIELVAGLIKLMGTYRYPEPGLASITGTTALMGQDLLNPPTVEGWHTGKEWIDGGTLNQRVNFAVNQIGDIAKPGIQSIINRLISDKSSLSQEDLVADCLELLGPLNVGSLTMSALLKYTQSHGTLNLASEEDREASVKHIARLLQLIVASPEYQYA